MKFKSSKLPGVTEQAAQRWEHSTVYSQKGLGTLGLSQEEGEKKEKGNIYLQMKDFFTALEQKQLKLHFQV